MMHALLFSVCKQTSSCIHKGSFLLLHLTHLNQLLTPHPSPAFYVLNLPEWAEGVFRRMQISSQLHRVGIWLQDQQELCVLAHGRVQNAVAAGWWSGEWMATSGSNAMSKILLFLLQCVQLRLLLLLIKMLMTLLQFGLTEKIVHSCHSDFGR